MKALISSLAIAASLFGATSAFAGGGPHEKPSILFQCDERVFIAWDNASSYVILGLPDEPRALKWEFTDTSSLIEFPNNVAYRANGPFALRTEGVLTLESGRTLNCVQTADDI
jgi:hypothetical protein